MVHAKQRIQGSEQFGDLQPWGDARLTPTARNVGIFQSFLTKANCGGGDLETAMSMHDRLVLLQAVE